MLGITINPSVSVAKLMSSPGIATALLPLIGYNKASQLASEMKDKGIDIFQANRNLKLIDEEKLRQVLLPENLLKEGFSIHDIME